MFERLDRFYEFTKRHPMLYPIFVLVKFFLYLPPLIGHEGFGGAAHWLFYRFKFAFHNRKLLAAAGISEQPIEIFRSRHGFKLFCWIEYVIYDEIFLERVYEFSSLRKFISGLRSGVVLDFGVHHGLFIDFIQTWNPSLDFYGAELSPHNYESAAARFAGNARVTLLNLGIGGTARDVVIKLVPVSSKQSIYSSEGGEPVAVRIITAADFVALNQLTGREIALLKMDIEGAETEVFENFQSIAGILAVTRCFLIEIHDGANVPAITNRLAVAGFVFQERRGINFLFQRAG